ncbi:hypothetical protein V5O48_017053, partial [Marasmius crinis-equi]
PNIIETGGFGHKDGSVPTRPTVQGSPTSNIGSSTKPPSLPTVQGSPTSDSKSSTEPPSLPTEGLRDSRSWSIGDTPSPPGSPRTAGTSLNKQPTVRGEENTSTKELTSNAEAPASLEVDTPDATTPKASSS